MAEPLGQPYRDEWGNVWQDYPGDNGQPNSVLIEMNNYPGQNRGASPGYGQLGAPSASGQDRYGSGGYGQSPMGQTVGNPDRFGSSGYGTYTTGGNYTGAPAAPAADPVAPAPVSNEYVAPAPAPAPTPAPAPAPASSNYSDSQVAAAIQQSMDQGFTLEQSATAAANIYGVPADQLARVTDALVEPVQQEDSFNRFDRFYQVER